MAAAGAAAAAALWRRAHRACGGAGDLRFTRRGYNPLVCKRLSGAAERKRQDVSRLGQLASGVAWALSIRLERLRGRI